MKVHPSGLLLLGTPVAHSLSPVMQNAALRAAQIPVQYVARDISEDQLPETMQEVRRRGLAGNVTIPHKTAVAGLCDVLTPIATRVGAVNTFWMDNGVLHGDNTDVGGFDAAVRSLIGDPKRGLRVTLLGAGGSAAAVTAAIAQWDHAELTIWNRTPERAEALAQYFDTVRVKLTIPEAVQGADLVINATPHGLADDIHPVDLKLLAPETAIFDLVYRIGETPWVNAARKTGHPAADGLGMLIEQGARAFECWFGIAPDRNIMGHAIMDQASENI